jgi:hypothetical protein
LEEWGGALCDGWSRASSYFIFLFSSSFSGRVVRADSTISSSSITMSLLTLHSKVGRVCVLVAPFAPGSFRPLRNLISRIKSSRRTCYDYFSLFHLLEPRRPQGGGWVGGGGQPRKPKVV